MADNDRGTLEPHRPCSCVECADKHGDQAEDAEVLRLRAGYQDLLQALAGAAGAEREACAELVETIGILSPLTNAGDAAIRSQWAALGLGTLHVSFNPAARVASHRATTSSRTPGKVNRGTVYASGFEHDPAHFHVCPCGCPQQVCPDCLAYVCRAPGHAPHVCRSGW